MEFEFISLSLYIRYFKSTFLCFFLLKILYYYNFLPEFPFLLTLNYTFIQTIKAKYSTFDTKLQSNSFIELKSLVHYTSDYLQPAHFILVSTNDNNKHVFEYAITSLFG